MALHKRLFFLLLALLPIQLGLHFWPEWAMVLGRRVDYLSPTVYLTDVLVITLLASWLFDIFHHKFLISNFQLARFQRENCRQSRPFLIKRKNFKFLKKKILPLFLLFSFIVVNIFVASSKPVALYKWFKIGEFVGLGWYIIKTRPHISHITYYLSLGVLYSSLLGIAQFFLQHSLGGIFWWLGERTFAADTPGIARISWGREFLRPYATFPHPNVLGGFLVVTLPLLIFNFQFEIFNQTKKFSISSLSARKLSAWQTIFKLVTITLALIALLLTFSRSAWVAGAVGIAFVKRKFFFPLLLLLFILAFKFNVNEESVVVRQQLNSAAFSMWQQSPIIGVGLGNFLVELPKFLVSRDVYFLQPVHNIYLLLLAETGLFGLGLFLWLIFRIFKNFQFSIFKFQSMNKYQLSIIVLLLLGLVDHYPLTLQQGQLLLTILLVLQ